MMALEAYLQSGMNIVRFESKYNSYQVKRISEYIFVSLTLTLSIMSLSLSLTLSLSRLLNSDIRTN